MTQVICGDCSKCSEKDCPERAKQEAKKKALIPEYEKLMAEKRRLEAEIEALKNPKADPKPTMSTFEDHKKVGRPKKNV